MDLTNPSTLFVCMVWMDEVFVPRLLGATLVERINLVTRLVCICGNSDIKLCGH
jgi:hypothetical protein